MPNPYKNKMIDNEAFTRAMGNITIKFALLEEFVTDCINILLGIEGADVITAGLTFPRSLNILKALYKQRYNIKRDDDIPSEYKTMFSQASEANDRRNTFIHSFWNQGNTQDSIERIKKQLNSKGIKTDIEQVDIQEINNTVNFIESTALLAQEFTQYILQKYTTVLISPAAQAVLINGNPKLKWTQVPGAAGYELQIVSSPDFSNIVVDATGINSIKDTIFEFKTTVGRNNTYYWRVRPILTNALGFWSIINSFTIQ